MTLFNFSTVKPATGEQIESFTFFGRRKQNRARSRSEELQVLSNAFRPSTRATLKARRDVTSEQGTPGEVITIEIGKILREAEAEVEKCARGIRSPEIKDFIVRQQIPAHFRYVANPNSTVVETKRLEKVGKAVDEFLDKVPRVN